MGKTRETRQGMQQNGKTEGGKKKNERGKGTKKGGKKTNAKMQK